MLSTILVMLRLIHLHRDIRAPVELIMVAVAH